MLFEILTALAISIQPTSNVAINVDRFKFEEMIDSSLVSGERKDLNVDIFYSYRANLELSREEKIHAYSTYSNGKILDISSYNLLFDRIEGAKAFPIVSLLYKSKSIDAVKNDLFEKLPLDDIERITISDYFEYSPVLVSNEVSDNSKEQKSDNRDTFIDYRDIPYDNFENGTEYTGLGVKIGIADGGQFDRNHPNFSYLNISPYEIEWKDSSITPGYSHFDYTMSTITGKYGIAPRADIVMVNAFSSIYAGWRHLEVFADENVDVVNLSVGTPNSGSDLHNYVDFFVYNYQIPVVCSAPNGFTGYLTQPCSAQNVITVCSVDPNRVISSGVFLRDPDDNGGVINAFRIAATGNGRSLNIYGNNTNGDGTSIAAPVVTGAIALMMEKNPALKGNVPMLMAALANGANQSPVGVGSSSINDALDSTTGLKAWSGVGTLDITQSLWISGFISTPNISLTAYTESYLFSIDNVVSGQTLYTTHSWLKKLSLNGQSYTEYMLSDYDLILYDSYNNVVSRTTGVYTNIERHKFVFTHPGNYLMHIKIYNSTLSSSIGQYGLSCVRAT